MLRHTFLLTITVLGCTAAAQVNSSNASPATTKGALERLVTGAPFSAESKTEIVQTLADGSHVKRVKVDVVARDSSGRTRYSKSLTPLTPGGLRVLTFIRDRVAGVRYLMDSKETVARREQLPTASLIAKQ